jgi:Tfp pilus assembly protein PilF
MDRESNNQRIQNRERARDLWELGVQQLMSGHIRAAVDSFNRSLAIHPTAEGYTYRGWAISFLGRLDEAIEDCKRAIGVDPEFGNPYNDIGVYLMQMGSLDEAIPWLEKAKSARRYDPKHFPFLNLGNIFMAKGDQMRALEEYVKALDIDPENEVALKAIAGMDLQVN